MAKAKVTKKCLNESYPCISVAYCGLQHLLTFRSPDYYTCGVYGWNCDAYRLTISDHRVVCITTGYRGLVNNFDNNNTYDLYREYDTKAEKILSNRTLSAGDTRHLLSALLDEYLCKVLG